MSITLTIGRPDAIVHLKAVKTMAGDIMLFDHPEMDVVISPAKQKILALSKEQYGSHIYATQSRLFDHLAKHGVVDPSTIHGGNIFGSLEGTLLEVEEKQKESVDSLNVAVYSVAKFFEHEREFYDNVGDYENEVDQELLDPDDENSTALGHVPHEPRKGSLNTYPGSTAAYGLVGYSYE